MDLQFVFGNPTRGKKKKTKKKGAKNMAKRKKHRRVKRKANPIRLKVKHKGKVKHSKAVFTGSEKKAIQKRISSAIAQAKHLPISQRPPGMIAAIQQIKNMLKKDAATRESVAAFLGKYEKLGAKVKVEELSLSKKSKGGKVAKRKKAKKKKVSRKKKAKKASHKKVSKKKKHKKVSSKKAHKKAKRAKRPKAKKAHKRKAKRHSRRKKPSKIVLAHKFGARKDKVSASIPKLKKGKKASKKYKRKNRRYSFMVKRTNPIFGSPRAALNKVDKQFQTATGHDLMEAGLLFGAGAALPLIEGLLMKIPGASDVRAKIGSFGPEAASMSSSLVTILGLGALHYAIEKVPALSKASKAEPAIRALIAASVVKAGSAMSGVVARATGMSGVLYSPMSGVNFTPGMSGVNFTPMSGQPQMGIYPTLNGAPQMGYGADFGRGFDVSDYGGGAGYTEDRKMSKSDFGGCDDDADYGDEEPVLDQSGGTL